MARPNPTQAEVDAVARQLLATVEEPPRRVPLLGLSDRIFVKQESCYGIQPSELEGHRLDHRPFLNTLDTWIRLRNNRMRTYPTGCTCPKMKIGDPPQTYDPACPIAGHQRLAK